MILQISQPLNKRFCCAYSEFFNSLDFSEFYCVFDCIAGLDDRGCKQSKVCGGACEKFGKDY